MDSNELSEPMANACVYRVAGTTCTCRIPDPDFPSEPEKWNFEAYANLMLLSTVTHEKLLFMGWGNIER